MALPDLFDHLLNFVAPAFAVGFLCAALGRVILGRAVKAPAWWAQGAINFAVGVAVLAAGLLLFGHDAMMVSYVALVLACGTCQWLLAGGWRA